ncbi:hypothetical protein [Caulobacter sp. UNC279MFTsu5.1]|uniref:hypothetical protein n=1 Tax=Caulobacter sp. UNC279MFTsu5.1 TaxID=1502775 RepID=UPI0008EFCD3F|nr:hypothetical protein [Caulobacter sp. UNC279MFTsu5.1]SFK58652.1 hypothetical protein SAMN02799626_04660 [Caulobacter sp. UNC279MFTsu5.1]
MHALPRPRPAPLARSAEIVPFEELNRARTLRALARDAGPPGEPHPWAYAFPRPLLGQND